MVIADLGMGNRGHFLRGRLFRVRRQQRPVLLRITFTMRDTLGWGGRKSFPVIVVTSDQVNAGPNWLRSVASPTARTAVRNDRPGSSLSRDSVTLFGKFPISTSKRRVWIRLVSSPERQGAAPGSSGASDGLRHVPRSASAALASSHTRAEIHPPSRARIHPAFQ